MMREKTPQIKLQLRVWRDQQLSRLWWLAFHDGDEEVVLCFPDSHALGDFVADRVGLSLLGPPTPLLPIDPTLI